jgi:hypothetical protein
MSWNGANEDQDLSVKASLCTVDVKAPMLACPDQGGGPGGIATIHDAKDYGTVEGETVSWVGVFSPMSSFKQTVYVTNISQ